MLFSNSAMFSQALANVVKFNKKHFLCANESDKCCSLDEMDCQCKSRETSSETGMKFLISSRNEYESKIPLLILLASLMHGDEKLTSLFAHASESKLCVPALSHDHPAQKTKFLCHALMIIGCIATESEIFNSSNLLDAFRAAELFSDNDNRRDVVNNIMKKLILSDFFTN